MLKEGGLIEKGTHDNLMKSNAYYKYLYNMQNSHDLVNCDKSSLEIEKLGGAKCLKR